MYVEGLPANTGHAELYDEFHAHLAKLSGKAAKHVSSRESEEDSEAGKAKRKPRFRWM